MTRLCQEMRRTVRSRESSPGKGLVPRGLSSQAGDQSFDSGSDSSPSTHGSVQAPERLGGLNKEGKP